MSALDFSVTSRNGVFSELGLPNIANQTNLETKHTQIYSKKIYIEQNIFCTAPSQMNSKCVFHKRREREDIAKEDDTRAEITRATKVNTSGQT